MVSFTSVRNKCSITATKASIGKIVFALRHSKIIEAGIEE
jgi:hypothetical protein